MPGKFYTGIKPTGTAVVAGLLQAIPIQRGRKFVPAAIQFIIPGSPRQLLSRCIGETKFCLRETRGSGAITTVS